jgi:preprotein translocase subunit SecA
VEQETGIENIYDEANYRYVHYMQQALKAQVLFQEGRDYIRQRKQIILIDQHTGRLMPNRRLSEGLHQAIEAKEGRARPPPRRDLRDHHHPELFPDVREAVRHERHGLTEAEEFYKIYKLDVTSIPTTRRWPAPTMPTWCIAAKRPNSGPWPARSWLVTAAGSRCWWAPPRWRCPSAWAGG